MIKNLNINKKLFTITSIITYSYILMNNNIVMASGGDVSGVIEDTWNKAELQIKAVVNNVVFPALDIVLAILLFIKISTAYFAYHKGGEFDWQPIAILFVCLVFSLTAPNYIWNIL